MGELHAKFAWAGCCCCLWILCPGPVIHWHCSQAPPPPCQFRMQFPSGIALVRIGLRRCVTCVFELHAKFVWTMPCRCPPHRWGLCSIWAPLLFGTAARPRRYSAISHVIPLRLLQTLNSCRWNCNVFRRSQKMTVGNYVRNLSGPGPAAALHTGGASCAVVLASPVSALRSVQNSPCLASWW